MSYPKITNTFYNTKVIKSSEINENYTDILNAVTDGLTDIKLDYSSVDNIRAANASIKGGNLTNVSGLDVIGNSDLNGPVESTESTLCSIVSLDNNPGSIELDNSNAVTLSNIKTYVRAAEYNNGDTNDITVDSSNNSFEVTENGESAAEVVTVANGTYTGAQMATEIQTKMNAALTQTYSVTYSGGANGTYTISCAGQPFILWVTGGQYITTSLLPFLGFKLGGTAGTNTEAESHTSDVSYKIGYYNKIETINCTANNDGEIYQVQLQPYSYSASYVPIIVSVYENDPGYSEPDIALTKNSLLMLQYTASSVTGSAGVRVLAYSSNFNESNY